ncbi:hypothetical protein [Pseudovibrio sp. Alg231-02]|uniref:hypothetical protein n=1 Tax=Pseudovibrio sp. Alg231-02 TaxID=1922223 RepID=UPI0035932570
MRIRMMMVIMSVVITVMMVVSVAVVMGVTMRMIVSIRALAVTLSSTRHITQLAFSFITQAFHVMVVALLWQTDLSLKPKNLFSVLTKLAVHVV